MAQAPQLGEQNLLEVCTNGKDSICYTYKLHFVQMSFFQIKKWVIFPKKKMAEENTTLAERLVKTLNGWVNSGENY